jgi:hypothetical protein
MYAKHLEDKLNSLYTYRLMSKAYIRNEDL